MKYNLQGEEVLQNMAFNPTLSQEQAARTFAEYMGDDYPYSVFLLKGYAGTGKTTLLDAITRTMEDIGLNCELLATTGRAAKVLAQATGRTATTIHRKIYRATAASVEEGGAYKLASSSRPTLFIVDEASMISTSSSEITPFGTGNLLHDLLEYVWQSEGCKLILVGDTAQLPPVGSDISEALDAESLRAHYGMHVYEAELRDVVRQKAESGILEQATYLREVLEEYPEAIEGEPLPLHLNIGGQEDLKILPWEELTDTIDTAYRKYGKEHVLIITPSNKRALMHNQGVRSYIFDYEDEIVRRERLTVARNNYYYAQKRDRSDFIANGEIVELLHTYKHYHMYGLHFVDASIALPDREEELDVRLLLSGLADEQAQRTYEQRLELYNALATDYQAEAGSGIIDVRRAIRKDPFWGALEIKYGYAVTAHKAQGGQWPCVIVDMSFFGFMPHDRSMIRWLYTAITRATERVYLLNVPENLYSLETIA
jgi:hypothetical protein